MLKARAYLQSLRPNGGTNIHDALVEALRQESRPGMLPLVLFLTDGLPTIGQTSEVAIREAVAKGNAAGRRIFTLGVGADVNVPLLDRVAEVSGGAPTYVLPNEDVEVKIAQVFRQLYGPVLADGSLQTLDRSGNVTTVAVRELIPGDVPDLFEGDQFVLLGQYRGHDPLTFRLRGTYLGKPREFRFHFELKSATTRNAFVPRLWASRRIAFLIDQIRQAGAFEGERPAIAGESLLNDPRYRELVQEILRLSTEFGILSEYTSFLATEGTDLSDWDKLNLICNSEIDRRAVKNRWGTWAVAQGKNVVDAKKQSRVKFYNDYLDSKLRRVQITDVQQSCARGFFKRGNRWIDGQIVAARTAQTADSVVDFGTVAYATLLDKLVKEGRQALIAKEGEVLVRIEGRNVLVRNRFDVK
jgi:Ca-activated chloride channel family protein